MELKFRSLNDITATVSSPLINLMEDQISSLNSIGIGAIDHTAIGNNDDNPLSYLLREFTVHYA